MVNGSILQTCGLKAYIAHLFSSVRNQQPPSFFLRSQRIPFSSGDSKKSLKPFSSMRFCSVLLTSGGCIRQQAPQFLHRKPTESGKTTFSMFKVNLDREKWLI